LPHRPKTIPEDAVSGIEVNALQALGSLVYCKITIRKINKKGKLISFVVGRYLLDMIVFS